MAAQLCIQATEDPNMYVFGELLSVHSIQALENNPEKQKYFQLLRLFAHGTLYDYQQNRHLFPPLSEAQLRKLRALTLVSLAHGHNELRYEQLRSALAVQSTREIEDVVIDAVYAGLIRARMNQQAGTVEIIAAEGRDVVFPAGIESMVNSLKRCLSRANQLAREIDNKIDFIATNTNKAREHKEKAAAELDAVRSQLKVEASREAKFNRMRNKTSDVPTENDVLQYYRRDSSFRTMRTRRSSRSSDTDS
ncbi:COP9 signalosome complex subunit 7 [Gracilariopsis chorda]|uniref:COP9 signalosome complex subunit 7 n=1 Tax=Gracilariopsis chorda TaxID=448386 RepID=A0A2V3IRP1_9FLOR|nr:COP9 signalosome complex subunit 7 [Gracilariopsis chorda]|eukprot:PXF44785.1 COP9 signalosome complex subunit 7 [Gracilariopsis chorda]